MSELQNLLKRIKSLVFEQSSLAARGEKAAADFLERQGYVIGARNWRCKLGEIDLVAIKGSSLVFAEVKTRKSKVAKSYSGLDAVDDKKQSKIKDVAEEFLRTNHNSMQRLKISNFRFDVLELIQQRNLLGWERFNVQHHPGAFE
ncbi:MAG: YraN family protein [Bdellovibrionales bacterium]|nr:YraN family protein [Bdellovibrionales bacterium]